MNYVTHTSKRERMLRDNPSWRQEVRKKISESKKGKPLSLQTKLKISLTLKGRKQTLQHKIKRGIYKKRTFTQEWKQNISLAKKGKNLKFARGELRPIVYCSICGTMKVVKPSRAQYYDDFLCSLECKSIFYTGRITPEETKQKIAEGSHKMWKREGFREKYHYLRAEESPWFGKEFPKEMRDKMSKSAKIRANTEEFKERQRETRSKQIIPFKDTIPEKMVETFLKINNIYFEKQKLIKLRKSYHRTDFFIKPNICLEVDGCWYHYCIECNSNRNPTKMQINKMARDIFINSELNALGYNIIRIKEHEIKKNQKQTATNIIKLIKNIQTCITA